ncbi:acyltransferase [Dyella sp.]|uniref:acyltransferase family protein n=1 Tax=Dyella sp. TaxID=1869338 RepID=UPI002ED543CF
MTRLPGLDVLRAIAVTWVMTFHAYLVWDISDGVRPYWQFGWMGVDLFFVLSGYLIGSQVFEPLARGEPMALGRFYLRRAFRTFPAYLTVLALYAWWPAFREAPGMQPVWQFMTYTMNLLIEDPDRIAFSHAWSLCVEEHFYVLFPVLAWILARRSSMSTTVTAFLLVWLGGMALRTLIWLHTMQPLQDTDMAGFNRAFLQYIYRPSYSRLDGLLAGVALASIAAWRPAWWSWLRTRSHAIGWLGMALLAMSMAVFTDRTGLLATSIGYPLLSLALALLVCAATGDNWLARCQVPGARWLAATSYSLYLSHKAIFHLVHQALASWPRIQGMAALACYVLATLAGGALLYYLIERPFLRLRDAWMRRSMQNQTEPPAGQTVPG